jgi:hypothetical protein
VKGTAATSLLLYSSGVSKEGHKNFNGGNTAEFERRESIVYSVAATPDISVDFSLKCA